MNVNVLDRFYYPFRSFSVLTAAGIGLLVGVLCTEILSMIAEFGRYISVTTGFNREILLGVMIKIGGQALGIGLLGLSLVIGLNLLINKINEKEGRSNNA